MGGLVFWLCLVGSMVGLALGDITVQKFENQTVTRIAEFDDIPARGWGAHLGDKG